MRKFLLWSVTCVAVGSASACGGDDDGSKGGNGNANCVKFPRFRGQHDYAAAFTVRERNSNSIGLR